MTTILVADDHDLVRTGIVRMLNDVSGFNVVAEAKNGEDAVILSRKLMPDVVLTDVKMPGIGGLEATRKILQGHKRCKIIAVTSVADPLFSEKLLQAGAFGYVTKEAGFEEIITAIHAVILGNRYISTHMAQQVALKNVTPTMQGQSPFSVLSERELQTAIMVANNKKVADIAQAFSVSPKTVNTYRYRIYEKLEIDSDVELTVLAIKHKLVDLNLGDLS